MGKQLNIGIIGTGEFSLIHANSLKQCPDARLSGVWNRTQAKADKVADTYHCKSYATYQDLIADPEIDAILVLTNLETHHQFALDAIKAGKHVLIEKPVSTSVEKIEEIKNASEKAGVVCMPGHNNIYEDSIHRARNLIIEGSLGKVISIYVMYNIFHSEQLASRYPGVIRQIMTHNAYSLIYLGGQPKRLSAMKACLHYETYTEEDIAMVILEMENGAMAHLCASFAADDLSADPWTFIVKVIGTRGSTRYTYQDWVETGQSAYHSRSYTGYQGSVANELKHFVSICRLGGAPLSTLDDAITSQKIIEAVEKSIADGCQVTI